MSEEHYRLLCWISGFCFILGGVLLILVSRKKDRELDELDASAAKLQAGLDAPSIDEDWAHQLEAGPEGSAQTTRDNGA